jgi:hypothetical protein
VTTGLLWALLWGGAVLILGMLVVAPVAVTSAFNSSAARLFGPDVEGSIRTAMRALQDRRRVTYEQQRHLTVLALLGTGALTLLILPFDAGRALMIGGLLTVLTLLARSSLYRGQVMKQAAIKMEDAVLSLLSHLRLLMREGIPLHSALSLYVSDYPHSILAQELSRVLAATRVGMPLVGVFTDLARDYDNAYLMKLADAIETLVGSDNAGSVLVTLTNQMLADFETERLKEIEQKVTLTLLVSVGGLITALLMILLEPSVFLLIEALV